MYLIEDEDLKRLLDRNPDLKKEVEETEKLINTKLKIKTIEKFDEIVGKITELGFKTAQEAKEKAEKLGEVKTEEELKYCLNAKKFCYYETALDQFCNLILPYCNDSYFELFDDFDDNDISIITSKIIEASVTSRMRDHLVKHCMDILSSRARTFFTSYSGISLILLHNERFVDCIRNKVSIFSQSTSEIILTLLSNQDRYNFFLQFHNMLEKNLPDEDKQLFYDYLKSCREKLQNQKDNYRIFNKQVRNLTYILIVGIIALAVVLILSLFNIVNLMWLFYIGIVLTVAVGIRLFFCLRKNLNNLRKLEIDLQKEGKTIQDKIAEIDCAIDVYDLNKIRDFKDPELEKIPTIEIYKNKIINNNEINSMEQNDAPESEQDNSGENIKNINNL